ncbi:type II toxin-antitoxin system VapC family toxin [Infirmifilum sp. NZ]|uniref:type II toxin-antitoxin system VapC family toxin n=1 Tax=Infirmifilum sp. NZ TaxID=2926850 RepID=UPI0027A2BCDE|nr:PIN domain-containing protein [Infirmifilum sp. NZ]UNQ73906.1 PIN domain-containing protein [Infirmifilum sp. NZ]
MAEEVREVIVDTYALLAMVFDEVGARARDILEEIRWGRVKGLLPVTVAYEYVLHWLRGRIPAFKSSIEVLTYLRSYFKVVNLSLEEYVQAARVKVRGDALLERAEDESLRSRRLSIVDSTVIALALGRKVPILTGDRDLAYVALKEGVEVIW